MQIHIRVIAPAFSLGVLSQEVQSNAKTTFSSLEWELSFGKNVLSNNDGSIESIKRRVEDIHQALIDPSVTHLMAVIGGWDSHELLPYINWELWSENPKPLIGYSDITAIQNAAYAKSEVKSIHGPAYSTFGQKNCLEFSIKQLRQCLSKETYCLDPAEYWVDDEWFLDLSRPRSIHTNSGYQIVQSGEATGIAIGGNLSTLVSLAGTDYMPTLAGSVIFLEDIETITTPVFRRLFQQLFMQPETRDIRGIVFGRMQLKSEITSEIIAELIKRFVPNEIPVLMNASFGHTYPVGAFPIGNPVTISSNNARPFMVVD